jgi:hypothetical protein
MAIAGCGGSSAGAPLAAPDSATLNRDISAIRVAAAASDPSAAHAAAAGLRADVERLRGEGRLSQTDSESILVGSMQVEGRISAEVHAASPAGSTTEPAPAPVTTPAAPAPTPAAPGHQKDHSKGQNAPPGDQPAPPKPHDHGGGHDGGQ